MRSIDDTTSRLTPDWIHFISFSVQQSVLTADSIRRMSETGSEESQFSSLATTQIILKTSGNPSSKKKE